MIIVTEVTEMNVNDIKVALQYLAGGNEFVIMQCAHARDIPLIKREIFRLIGEPNKMIDHRLYYPIGEISIVPVHREERLRGYTKECQFYVAYKDNSDWVEKCIELGYKQRLVPYEVPDWVSLSDIYNLLLRDGMSSAEALHRMACDGLIQRGEPDEYMS